MPIEIPDAMLNRATELALRNSALQLNLNVDQISAPQRQVLQSTVRQALEEHFSGALDAAARNSAAEVVKTSPEQLKARLADKLSIGAEVAKLVAGDEQYHDLLAKNAHMQKAKFDAYVTAGFTEDQAFRLLEAEVLGKSGAKAAR